MSFHEERRKEADDVFSDFVNEFRRRQEPIRRLRSTSNSDMLGDSGKEKEAGSPNVGRDAANLQGSGQGLSGDAEAHYHFLMKRFNKSDLAFQVPSPKPIYTEDKGSLSITYGTMPVVNMQKRKLAIGEVDWREPIM